MSIEKNTSVPNSRTTVEQQKYTIMTYYAACVPDTGTNFNELNLTMIFRKVLF